MRPIVRVVDRDKAKKAMGRETPSPWQIVKEALFGSGPKKHQNLKTQGKYKQRRYGISKKL